MLRILLTSLDALSGLGGIQRFSARLIRALDELVDSGLIDEVVSLSLWDPPGTSAPGQVRHHGFARRKGAFAYGLARALHLVRPDLVLWGHVLLLRFMPLVKFLYPQARHALLVYGNEVWGHPHHREIPPVERAFIRRMARIVSISRVTAERMTQAYRLSPELFVLLPPGVDLLEGGEITRLQRDNGFALLTVSRLSSSDGYKGVETVLRALPSVVGEVPLMYTVVGDGELRSHYESLARTLGIERHVRFVGNVSEEGLDFWYRWADAFVLPSGGEGFGIVYLEAWLRHLPIVAGREGGAAEVIDHSRTGLLVDPSSPPEVSQALRMLASDRGLCTRLGGAGRAEVEARYTHDHFRAGLGEILTSLGSETT